MLCSKHIRFVGAVLNGKPLLSALLSGGQVSLAHRLISTAPGPGGGSHDGRRRRPSPSASRLDRKKSHEHVPEVHETPVADVELPLVKVKRSEKPPTLENFENVTMPSRRRATPERVTLLARIDHLFEKHPRTRAGFVNIVSEYLAMDKTRRGHPEFINTAVSNMEEFGVIKDAECYQLLMDCFPKGRYIPRNAFDAMWPTAMPQIEAAVGLLQQMDRQSVLPDFKLVETASAVLGWRSAAVTLALEIGWWKSMLQDADQYYIPDVERYRPFIKAGFVLKRMAGKASVVEIVRPESVKPDCLPWVLAVQSNRQKKRASTYERLDLPLHVEGPRVIYMQDVAHYYYALQLDSSVSDADSDDPGERTTLSICITPTGCLESVSCWVESVKKKYPRLADCQIFFSQKTVPMSPYACFTDVSPPALQHKSSADMSSSSKLEGPEHDTDLANRLMSDPF